MKSYFYSLCLGLLLFVFSSCQKESKYVSSLNLSEPIESKLVLGEKLENPYSVANMRRAYSALCAETRAEVSSDEIIKTTHRYIKFLPQNERDVYLLKADSLLILFEYPLDYEIISYGSYHDPNYPEDCPTPLYASVPINHNLPDDVDYQVLEDLFIPDEYPQTETRSYSSAFAFDIDDLVNKSLELTGNYEPDYSETKAGSSWHPRGSILYYDSSVSSYVPIEGLPIRCRRWFTTYTHNTNWKGEFYFPETFSKPAEYSVVFERYDFEIHDSWLSTAKYQQSNVSGEWRVDFKDNALYTYFCTVFRAAHKYYYEYIHGLATPPKNSFWKNKLTILASTKKNDKVYGNNAPWRRFFADSEIKIYTYDEDNLQTYATTIHELAHAAHWQLVIDADGSNRNSDFNFADTSMVESWAAGVQWFLTKDTYTTYPGKRPFKHYTNVVIDLIDDDSAYNNGKRFDGVTGISIVDIQNALIGCNTWEGWKNNIIKKYESKKTQIEKLFNDWKASGGF